MFLGWTKPWGYERKPFRQGPCLFFPPTSSGLRLFLSGSKVILHLVPLQPASKQNPVSTASTFTKQSQG